MGVALNKIPGWNEAVSRAKAKTAKARENAWKGLSVEVFGFKLRPMTVRDYLILEHYGSPFVCGGSVAVEDVAFALWALSHECQRWNESRVWLFRSFASYLHTRRVKRKIGDKLQEVVQSLRSCVADVFMDAPPSVRAGKESGLSYLTHWIDLIQSEHGLSQDEIFAMPLAQLFQRLRAIYVRRGERLPVFNREEDKLKSFIIQGLQQRKFTFDDLQSGRVKLEPKNGDELRANLN